jgi:hypothetical protein
LNCVDYKGRLPVENCFPVSPFPELEDLGDGAAIDEKIGYRPSPMVIDTWIADCVLHKKIGHVLRESKKKEAFYDQFLHHRAEMKLFKLLDCPAEYNTAEENAQKSLEQFQSSLVMAQDEVNTSTSGSAGMTSSSAAAAKLQMERGISTMSTDTVGSVFENSFNSDIVMAFVTFQYNESLARCMEDYKHYSGFPWTWFTPKILRFTSDDYDSDFKIQVSEAMEPDEILWENLDVEKGKRFLYRSSLLVMSLSALVICFVIVLEIITLSNLFTTGISSLCTTAIPALYVPANASLLFELSPQDLQYSTAVRSFEPARPPDDLIGLYDGICSSLIPNTRYGIYASRGDFAQPLGNYSWSACR